jgi:hypothetical protein
MLALYRCGRQADALEAYMRLRNHLSHELGLEPGPDARKLHQQILEQSPELVFKQRPVPGEDVPQAGVEPRARSAPRRSAKGALFLSYAAEDRGTARFVAERLENVGWDVWWDRQLIPGTNFSRRIREQLNAANCVVVLWSRASVDSDWVEAEANIAHRQRKLIPVLIEPVEHDVPLEFSRLHNVDLSDWGGDSEDHELISLLRAADGLRA